MRQNIKPNQTNPIFVSIVNFLSSTMLEIIPSRLIKILVNLQRQTPTKTELPLWKFKKSWSFPKEMSYRKQIKSLLYMPVGGTHPEGFFYSLHGLFTQFTALYGAWDSPFTCVASLPFSPMPWPPLYTRPVLYTSNICYSSRFPGSCSLLL